MYCMIVVREDGSREITATGISEEMADAIRKIVGERDLGGRIVLEPEAGASSAALEARPR